MSVICAVAQPAVICEKNKVPVVDLPILVSYAKYQLGSMVQGDEQWRLSGPVLER